MPATLSHLSVFIALATINTAELSDREVLKTKESESTSSIERIQVTGELMSSPGVVELSTKRIRQPMPAQDGADFLRSITGFHTVRKGGASGDPVFRGMSGSRLTILTDGALTAQLAAATARGPTDSRGAVAPRTNFSDGHRIGSNYP